MSDPTRVSLELDAVTKHFGNLHAVDGFTAALPVGGMHGLIGPNGAGKTTLVNLITGFYSLTAGDIRLFGQSIIDEPIHERNRLGLARTFQHAELVDELDVVGNVMTGWLGRVPVPLAAWLASTTRARSEVGSSRERACAILDRLGLVEYAEAPVQRLTQGQRRLVGLARALFIEPRVLLLDEPAAGLVASEVEALVSALETLRRDNDDITILLIEHRIDLVRRLCDHILVVDSGRLIADGDPESVMAESAVVESYIGRSIEGGPKRHAAKAGRESQVVLQVDGVRCGYGGAVAVDGVSLGIRQGVMTAIVGTNGAGKSTLIHAIAGLHDLDAGSIMLDGQDVTGLPVHTMIGRGLALVPEGRQLFADQTVEENLLLGATRLGPSEARRRMEQILEQVPILANRRKVLAGLLSGGEQQLLALGRAFVQQPRVLILDEPTLGLAPVAVQAVLELIEEIRSDDVAILISEQRAELVLGVCDYAYVMHAGRIVAQGPGPELAGDDALLDKYLGGDLPEEGIVKGRHEQISRRPPGRLERTEPE